MNQAPQYPVPQQPVGAVAPSRVVTITPADPVQTPGFPIRALYGLGQPPILVRPSALFRLTADVPAFINLLPNLVQALVTT